MRVLGDDETLNQSLEKAGRVADFFELGELMCHDALHREESLRRPLPRRAPDRGRRGAARRRQLRLRRARGSATAWTSSRALHKEAARVRERPRWRSGATSEREAQPAEPVWRQAGPDDRGRVRDYDVDDVSDDMSFLEMLDVVNERLIAEGTRADRVRPRLPRGHLRLVRDDDQRPRPTAPRRARRPASCTCASSATATRSWSSRGGRRRSRSSRTSSSTAARSTGSSRPAATSPPRPAARRDANLIPVPKEAADAAMDAAACIGCGACVAACPNGAAQLFTAAKVAHLNLLPQGQPERYEPRRGDGRARWRSTSARCTNHGECEAACPKEISIDFIAMMNRDYIKAKFKNRRLSGQRARLRALRIKTASRSETARRSSTKS